jgi:TPR repeat protein
MEGRGVEVDIEEVAEYYKLSAGQSNAEGQNSYGDCLEFGRGVARDQGSLYGQKSYSRSLEFGRGVPGDISAAARHYKLSADQRNSNGQFSSGRCLEEGRGPQWIYASPRAGSSCRPTRTIIRAARLRWCLERGRGVPADGRDAARYFRQCTEYGNTFGVIGLCPSKLKAWLNENKSLHFLKFRVIKILFLSLFTVQDESVNSE